MGPEARVLSIGSRRCRSQCRPGTGAAFQKSQAPTGANVESMCRDRTSILQVFFRCRVCIRCACARPHGRTPGFQGPSGPTGEQKAPQIGASKMSRDGLEPSTIGLEVQCSLAELTRRDASGTSRPALSSHLCQVPPPALHLGSGTFFTVHQVTVLTKPSVSGTDLWD